MPMFKHDARNKPKTQTRTRPPTMSETPCDTCLGNLYAPIPREGCEYLNNVCMFSCPKPCHTYEGL